MGSADVLALSRRREGHLIDENSFVSLSKFYSPPLAVCLRRCALQRLFFESGYRCDVGSRARLINEQTVAISERVILIHRSYFQQRNEWFSLVPARDMALPTTAVIGAAALAGADSLARFDST
ncbi:hypothetical protein EVAR_94392_1 [Eumeta japonica]|uniref:Uncharacterized protein n=1 Tax=Eumeta variegata TaxID=151549 RepID=A0A4C1TPY5_EUMVA|nr:hypothetical protein EVAR_94392_1 [Eumeta japonica]